ncbi:MAG: EamA family transporter [Anaerolineae bacterium]
MTRDTTVRAAPRRGLLLILLAAALWGTSGVATKGIYGLSDATPLMVAALRLALGAPLLWLVYRAISGERNTRIAGRDLGWMALAGASLGLSQACYFAAIAAGRRGYCHAGHHLARRRCW